MRCQCVKTFGKPLVTCDWPDPEPKGTEVLVKITASGVCHSDVHIAEGDIPVGLPAVMGHEIAGRIVKSGPDAEKLDTSKNYLVFPWIGCGECPRCLAGQENYCTEKSRTLGVAKPGGYAEYVLVPHARYLVDLGDLDPSYAAPFACSGLTTFSAISQIGPEIYKNYPIVIMGAGGLGLMSLQILKALGAKGAIMVDINPQSRKTALEQGALAVVDSNAPDAAEQIHKIIGGGAKGIIDLVGAGSTISLAIKVVEKAGRAVIVGLFGGEVTIPTSVLPLKAVSLIGSYVGNLSEMRQLVELAKAGKVDPMPIKKIGFDDIPQALENLKKGGVIGRQVAVMA